MASKTKGKGIDYSVWDHIEVCRLMLMSRKMSNVQDKLNNEREVSGITCCQFGNRIHYCDLFGNIIK